MIRINLGCGWRNFGKDWVHIDGGNYPHLNSRDITKLPYEDSSVDLIYASHVIEYFDREEIVTILNEYKRALKSGGILRVSVPNFSVIAKLYMQGYPLSKFLGTLYGRMEMGKFGGETGKIIYHKTVYDYDNLKELLERVGFKKVRAWNWKETEHTQFNDHSQAHYPSRDFIPTNEKPFDHDNGILVSLNLECEK